MPLQHLPNSMHRVRAKIRTLSSPSIWLSILGVALILGVAWEYLDRRGARQLASDFSLDALTNSDNDDPSNWRGEVSGEEARVAADIDSSDILQQILSQQVTPSPVPTENSESGREGNIQRILEILANPESSPSTSQAEENGDDTTSSGTQGGVMTESNLFLQGLGFDEGRDSSASSRETNRQTADRDLFSGFFAPTNDSSVSESSPQLTPLEMGFQQLANPRTGSLGLMQPLSPSGGSQPQGANGQQAEGSAEGRNGFRGEAEAEQRAADGRATSAETLPAFAMPVPPRTGQSSQENTGVSTFTGYPYNPNQMQEGVPQTGMGNPYGSNPYAAPNQNQNQNVNPGMSGSPSNGYRRPTYITSPQNGSVGSPYGAQTGGQMGGYNPNASSNPYQGTPGDVLNPGGAVFRGPVPEGATGYPDGSMNATPESQESLRNQPVEPFSVPRTPPGRSIGGGRINTFANP